MEAIEEEVECERGWGLPGQPGHVAGPQGDYARAVAEFRWPELGQRFNWAVDWFDAIARDTDRPALVIVEEDGSSVERSFAEKSRASDRLASWLAPRGVAKGDPLC